MEMLNSFAGNAITAKARAIYGRRLTKTDYFELIKKRDVSEIASYLKQTNEYATYLKGINELSIHRGQLEKLLDRFHFKKALSLCHYDFSRKNGFYNHVMLDAEISIILQSLISLNSRAPQEIIIDTPTFIEGHTSFDFKALVNIYTFEGLLEVLADTPYHKVLARYVAPVGKINLSGCEFALKSFYYETVFALIDKYYKGKTKQALYEIILIEIELLNLTMIFRLKKYFKADNTEIKGKIIPYYYKLNKQSIEMLLETDDSRELVERMKLYRYDKEIENYKFYYIEDYTKRLRYHISTRLIRSSQEAPVVFFTLMTLSRLEIENLTLIIEGIRYGHEPSFLEKLLIL